MARNLPQTGRRFVVRAAWRDYCRAHGETRLAVPCGVPLREAATEPMGDWTPDGDIALICNEQVHYIPIDYCEEVPDVLA